MSVNHNTRPDLSKSPTAVQSARIGRSPVPRASLSERETEIISPGRQLDNAKPDNDSATVPVVSPDEEDSAEKSAEGNGEKEETPRSSTPPNPFDESDEGEKEEDESQSAANCLPSTPVGHQPVTRPVPAPRRVSEPTPHPRPAPRIRLLRAADGQWFLHRDKYRDGEKDLPFIYLLPFTSQVKTRSPPLLPNLVNDLSLLEGNTPVKDVFVHPL